MHLRPIRRLLLCGGASLGLLLWTGACGSGDTRPCNDCPDVSGTWYLRFETGAQPSSECEKLGRGLPQAPLSLTQVGSALSSEVEGVSLHGTLYDTYDFNLNGVGDADGGTASVSLNGRFIPARDYADAGERLQGSYSATFEQDGTSCFVSRGYTANRDAP